MTILQQDGLRAIEQCPHGEVPAYLRAAATEGAWRFHHTLTDYAPTLCGRWTAWRRTLG